MFPSIQKFWTALISSPPAALVGENQNEKARAGGEGECAHREESADETDDHQHRTKQVAD